MGAMRRGTSSHRLVGILLFLNLLVATCFCESTVPLPTDSERWTYWSNNQIGEFVRQMQAKNPKHCKAYNVGQSVMGNQMWSLTVSTKPDAFPRPGVSPSSLSPSFLFIGGVHGDEPVGRQLMIYLAEELCLGAGRSDADPEIRSILAGGTVHLLFAMNPDGFDLKRRGNANEVDLNRNFPDPIKEPKFPKLTGKEEPETLALMNYIDLLGNSLVGATHLHGGALVMVVPFDGNRDGTRSPNPTPDNELYLYLAKRYVEVQPEMVVSMGIGEDRGLFKNGIIQGSNWYPLWGGLQDFFYLKNKVYFTTIEMSDNKWPHQSRLPSLWNQHRPSMYAYMKAHLEQGLTVQVDFPPGSKEESVLVRMLNPEMGSQVEFTSKTTHSVHYPVPAGNYSVHVEWRSQELSNRVTLAGEVRPGERTTLRAEKPSIERASPGEDSGGEKVENVQIAERWTYWSNNQIGEFVRQMQAKNPKHCKAYNVGQSVMGNQMWSLTVSTKPDAFPRPGVSPSSLSPSFLFIGGVHGDEPVGRQLMIYLAEELCLGAGRSDADPEIRSILAGGTVHLLFAMNPDGFDLKRRGNANEVDLNRNFPDPIKEPKFPKLTGKEEPETLALMNYIDLLGNSLVGATHLHGGALVMVVPFDGNRDGTRSPNPTPDNELYLYLAKRYVEVQPEMVASMGIGEDRGLFKNGIIQGSNWYPLWGGLQDFFYLKNKVYFTTIEMSDNKWPHQSRLPSLWNQHRPSMYAYMKAHLEQGLTVQVDFPPGSKEESVLVRMLNPEMGSQVEFTSKTTHSVHYPVPAGNYSVHVEWRSQELSNRVTLAGEVRPGERTTLRAEKASVPPTSAGAGAQGGGAGAPGEGAQSRMRRAGIRKGGVAVSAVDNISKTPGANEPKPTLSPYVKLFSVIVIVGLPFLGYRYKFSFARARVGRSHLRPRRGLRHV